MNRRLKKKKQRQLNKKLCERYPFIIPRNRWTDEILWENKYSWYYCHPYAFTELDSFPKGWYKAFGRQMMEEIREDCIKHNFLDKLRIMQIKEKYGGLRFYVGSIPRDSKIFEIIHKYEDMSEHFCEYCGRPSENHDIGGYWLSTICPKCQRKMDERVERYYKKIKKESKDEK